MKKNLLFVFCAVFSALLATAQVTQINSNKSLKVTAPLNNVKTILVSDIDSTVWATEGTAVSTLQLSANIKFEDVGWLLNGKLIFRGSTAATGSEVYITDGTSGGTALVKDIYTGVLSSSPADFAVLNGYMYFTAATAAEGRELWRTDGTAANTTLVKDLFTGPESSNGEDNYEMYSNGSYLLFAANTTANGLELWKSDGTASGTVLLKDIYAGADSSKPHLFHALNNIVLFVAKTAADGSEVWKTDGTPGGTNLVKNINTGPASSTELELFPGFSFALTSTFHTFNNRAYFVASDGTSTGQVWGTDGTAANTTLLSDIVPEAPFSTILLADAINLPSRFIFPVSDGTSRSELWRSDGTADGTYLIESFSPPTPGQSPFICIAYSFVNNSIVQNLFQGDKFFVMAGNTAFGDEMWVSDGTEEGTNVLKDINPGPASGVDLSTNFSYVYTNSDFFFSGSDGVHGNELWRTNGTTAGTTMVQDIYLNAGNSEPELTFVNNSKVIFSATDGDNPNFTDLFVVNGSFTPLPVTLTNFSVIKRNDDALLQWQTQHEINTSSFIIQRSTDALRFENIGDVAAMGNSATRQLYEFTDPGIVSLDKTILYYRLLIKDNDGKTSYSNVVSLKLKTGKWAIQLLGNPVLQNVQLAITGAPGNVTVSVKDITGRQVYSNKLTVVNDRITVPVAKLARGMYVLTVINNGERKSVRFVK